MQRTFSILFILVAGLIILSCMRCHDPLKPEYILSSNDSLPEGVTFDPVNRAFYAGSLEGGTITRIDADGTESIFFEIDTEVSLPA